MTTAVIIVIKMVIMIVMGNSNNNSSNSSNSINNRNKAPRVLETGNWGHAMAFTASPVQHLLIFTREIIYEQLAYEGHSSQVIQQTDTLAAGLWRGSTADVLLGEVREVLPNSEYKRILAFCYSSSPLLYSSLPASLKQDNAQQFSWPQLNPSKSFLE